VTQAQARRVVVRPARESEADAIARLNNFFADQHLMLRRTPEMIALAIDDYLVAVDERGAILGCGALKEYSPSVAEVAAIAATSATDGEYSFRAPHPRIVPRSSTATR